MNAPNLTVTSTGTHTQPTADKTVCHDKLIDPVAVLMNVSTLISETDRIKDWLDRFKALPWTPDEAADSLREALESAAYLDLPVQTVVRREKDRPVSLLQMVYHHFRPVCGSDKEAFDAIKDAIDASEVRHDGVAKERLETPELYYDRNSGRYWHLTDGGIWQAVKDSDAADLLIEAGVSRVTPADKSLSDVDRHLLNVRNEHGIDWAGPLAGHPTGPQGMLGNQILVTQSFNLIEPAEGEWEVIYAILLGMLGNIQYLHFAATLKIFYESLRDDRYHPGQMIVFCGPPDCLKSFTQHQIVTPIWGGRSADAARYLTGRTDFNAELCGAEHLFLDDAKPYGSWLSRHDFSESLKGLIVGKITSLHGKHKTPVNVNTRCRVTMSINDDDTSLRSLPDISESFEDKVHLFLCKKFELPMPNQTPAEKAAFDATIRAELPAFIFDLLHYDVPQDLLGVRFGVKHYHNPELLTTVREISDEARLDELIENVMLPTIGGTWTGSAAELQAILTSHSVYGKQAAALLSFTNAMGTRLGKLAKEKPAKYKSYPHKVNGINKRDWIIRLDTAHGETE